MDPVRKEFKARGEDASRVLDHWQLHTGLCAPIAEAIIDSCGKRNGTAAASSIYDYAVTGNIEVILKFLDAGYWGFHNDDMGGDEYQNIVAILVRFGHLDKAKKLVAAYPEMGDLLNAYGVPARDHIETHDKPLTYIPPTMQHQAVPADYERTAACSTAPYGTGGWPQTELEFPGWAQEARDGKCEIAQLSGREVHKDPTLLLRNFVVKWRPVILRDYLRHDVVSSLVACCLLSLIAALLFFRASSDLFFTFLFFLLTMSLPLLCQGLKKLIHELQRESLVKTLGSSMWESGTIPYAKTYQGINAPPEAKLSEYVRNTIMSSNAPQVENLEDSPPIYIFSDKGDTSKDAVGTDKLFPHEPEFVINSLPGVSRARRFNAQVWAVRMSLVPLYAPP